MMRVLQVKSLVVVAIFGALLMAPTRAQADPLLFQNFNDISTLGSAGWTTVNNSTPTGTTGWFQGNTGVFDAYDGPADSYIAANFENADLGGTIDNWLMLPEMVLNDGDTLTFYTRSAGTFPDSLQVRFSTNGGSSDTTDFTQLYLVINPVLGDLYPTGWTQYTVTLTGLLGPTNGRFAFRYYVPDTSANGDYIGIDNVSVDTAPVPEPASITLLGIGLAGLGMRRFRQSRANV